MQVHAKGVQVDAGSFRFMHFHANGVLVDACSCSYANGCRLMQVHAGSCILSD